MSNTVRCPTPDKVRFATTETAQQRADVRTHLGSSKIYRPYVCPCGWIHLTTQHKPPVVITRVTTSEELLALTPLDFRYIVSCDVKKRLDFRTSELLRTPEVNTTWNAELKLLWMESLTEYAEARDADHGRDILTFQKYISLRRREAATLRQRFLEQHTPGVDSASNRLFTPVDPHSTRTLRREALYKALQQFCDTHFEELREIYLKELRRTWPEGKPFQQSVPLKFLKILRASGAQGLADDTAEDTED